MKKITTAAAVLCTLLTGCSEISTAVNDFVEHDANIGKNAPAVMGTIGDIEAINQSAESEAKKEEEEKLSAEQQKMLDQENKAHEIVSQMTSAEKIGQLLLARMPEQDPVKAMTDYQPAGFTLYGNDFEYRSPEQVLELTGQIAQAASVSPFFAVDEEGGSVVRVSRYPQYRNEPFSSPQLLYQRGGTDLLEIDCSEKSDLLKSIGLNFNLAPVADISLDETSYIYPRTLGQGSDNTAEGIRAMVTAYNRENVASCLKHFPGYGENTDTHKGTAHDAREIGDFRSRDFIPFTAGIEADEYKIPAVMVGHTVYDSLDPEMPASLSAPIHDILRTELSFDGIIMTDDMGMDALTEYAEASESSVYSLAVTAGNDLLCVSDIEAAFTDLTSAYEDGIITDEMLDERVYRIILMKLRYGIIE